MKTSFKISIPNPCNENWDKMTPNEKGRFCSVCQKSVYDFTKASDSEVIKTFAEDENLCGRFKNSQLNRNLSINQKKRSFWTAGIASIITLFGLGNHSAKAQGGGRITNLPISLESDNSEEFNQGYTIIIKELSKTPFTLEISLTIFSENKETVNYSSFLYDENLLPLTDIYITNKRTQVKTKTDSNGNFSISVKNGDILYCSRDEFAIELDKDKIKPIKIIHLVHI